MNKRKKAFIGAAIGAATSIASGIISSKKAKKAQRRAQAEANRNLGFQMAQQLTEQANNTEYLDQFKDKVSFKAGGKIKLNDRKKYQNGGVNENENTKNNTTNEIAGSAISGVGNLISSIISLPSKSIKQGVINNNVNVKKELTKPNYKNTTPENNYIDGLEQLKFGGKRKKELGGDNDKEIKKEFQSLQKDPSIDVGDLIYSHNNNYLFRADEDSPYYTLQPYNKNNKNDIYSNKRYFIEDWLKNRKDVIAKRYKDNPEISDEDALQISNRFIDNQLYNLDRVAEFTTKKENKEFPNIKDNKYYRKNYKKEYSNRQGLKGFHYEDEYLPYIAYNNPTESTIIHERTHALNPGIQTGQIKKAKGEVENERFNYYSNPDNNVPLNYNVDIYDNENVTKNYSKQINDYLDSDDEIYSRLMEYRYNNKIDPNKKWTIDEIRELKRNSSVEKSNHLIHRYNEDFLLKLFNDVAQNKNNTDNQISYAKMGGNKKTLIPNIIKGGVAKPLGNNSYLMKGKTHEQGGIDVGKNLEVENNEIMKIDNNKNVRILSAVPFLNGESPAQKYLNGGNFNNIFNAQEKFKDINKLNDDGTKAEFGTEVNNTQKTNHRKINLKGIKTTGGRPYNLANIERIYNSLDTVKSLNDHQRAAILGNVIEESGGVPNIIDGSKKFKDLLQWGEDRINYDSKENTNKDIDNSLNENLYKTLHNTKDRKSWTHGGEGSGYRTAKDAYNTFINSDDVETATHSFTRGYVRPAGKDDSVRNRTKVAKQIYQRIQDSKNNINEYKYGGKSNNNNGLLYSINGNVRQGLNYLPSMGSSIQSNIRKKASLGKWIKENPDSARDIVSAGINSIGNVVSYFINKNAINHLHEPTKPIAKQAAKLNTTVNINPQLDTLRESTQAYYRDVNRNTSSSNVALARKQNARINELLDKNTLYANKENQENQLINQDKLNAQSVQHANVDSYNQYMDRLNDFNNRKIELKSENLQSLINGLNQGVQDVISRQEKRRIDNRTLFADLIKNPNAIEAINEFGLLDELSLKQKNTLSRISGIKVGTKNEKKQNQ